MPDIESAKAPAANPFHPANAAVPILSAVIVSYNTREMTLECIRTLEAQFPKQPCEAFVVDNASSDGSAAAIAEAFPWVKLTVSERNAGFGAANNLALERVRGKYVLLLNSDAFPKNNALERMIDCLDRHRDVGVVGPRLLNADGSLQPSCWRFPSPTRAWLENLGIAALLRHHPTLGDYYHWTHDAGRTVDFVVGACMLVRREVIEQVGGFDKRFFMYAEESDWQKRIWEAGWKVAFTPEAEVTHLGGASGRNEPVKINHHFFRSLDLYTRKHHGVAGLISLRAAMTAGCIARVLLWAVLSLFPRSRKQAWPKLRLQAWLAWRQATSWNLAPM